MDALLPCPFCGREVAVDVDDPSGGHNPPVQSDEVRSAALERINNFIADFEKGKAADWGLIACTGVERTADLWLDDIKTLIRASEQRVAQSHPVQISPLRQAIHKKLMELPHLLSKEEITALSEDLMEIFYAANKS